MGRTVSSTPAILEGRKRKATQFADAAEVVAELADAADDVADAYVTLLVHAGIAASDVLCCSRLGEHASGDNHTEAIAKLSQVDPALARNLSTLLGVKTKAGYSHQRITKQDRLRAERACAHLVEAMNDSLPMVAPDPT